MAEWFKAAVLKTVERRRSGGSNPPCSVYFMRFIWSGDREAEGGSLLRSYTPKGYRGFKSPLLRTFFGIGCYVPIKFIAKFFETIAQLDRASDCGSEGRRFESS